MEHGAMMVMGGEYENLASAHSFGMSESVLEWGGGPGEGWPPRMVIQGACANVPVPIMVKGLLDWACEDNGYIP
jgi:hypothetical protein